MPVAGNGFVIALCEFVAQGGMLPSSRQMVGLYDLLVLPEYPQRCRHCRVSSGSYVLGGEDGHPDVGGNSRSVKRIPLSGPKDFVRQTEDPPVGKPSAQDIGEHTLSVLADSGDVGASPH